MISPFDRQTVTAQQRHLGFDFPLVLTPADPGAPCALAAGCGEILSHLSAHGAILFRGFGITSAQDFDAFVADFGLRNFPYDESLSNAVRRNRTSRIFTANEAPRDVEIFLHHEMAQTPRFPSHLFFFSEQSAESGGATPLCRSDVLLEQLEKAIPAFVARCRERGACYTLTMPAVADQTSGQGRSWRQTLGVESREAAERRLASLQYQWCWLPDDNLSVTTPALPLIRQTQLGREVFFNQLIAAYCGWQDQRNDSKRSVTYGDGSEFDEADLKAAVEIAYGSVFDLAWQTGDVALIDNYLVMHGRRPYAGQRSVLASLCIGGPLA